MNREGVSRGVLPSSDERERCVDVLAECYAAGRLGYDDFQQRIDTALRAVSRDELDKLRADLPCASDLAPVALMPSALVRGWVKVGLGLAVLFTSLGVVFSTTGNAVPPYGVCTVSGVAAAEEQTCPAPTRLQRQLQDSVERADAAASQAGTSADGADEGSRLYDLGIVAEDAAKEAHRALVQAQIAATKTGPGARSAIRAAADRADRAASRASRAAILADHEQAI